MRRHWVYSGHYPRIFVAPKNARNAETKRWSGAVIAIVARELEEKATTATMMAACVTGSIMILKANFMPGADGKWGNVTIDSREIVSEGACMRGRKPGIITMTKVGAAESPWFLVWVKI